MKYLFTLCLLLLTCSCSPTYSQLSKNTVKITTLDETSGGSGVILHSQDEYSEVLTNAHVCDAIKLGGLIHTHEGLKFLVDSFKKSKSHDICLITLNVNLGVNQTVSNTSVLEGDEAIIAGHPSLLPFTITKGYFSSLTNINVLVGAEPCTEEDLKGKDAFYCLFFGKKPIFRMYTARYVSALIKPGSSGSAVYNSRGELSGLVFAGAGDLGFAFTVPKSYILFFLNEELSTLQSEIPGA